MEKYSKWNDKATGINPFTPVKSKTGNLRMILMIPVKIIKFILLCIMLTSYLIVSTFFSFVPILFLRRFFERYIDFIFCYGFLVLFGFYNLREQLIEPQNRKSEKSVISKHIEYAFHGYQTNDILICNSISYLQLLYFGLKMSPLFLTIVKHEDSLTEDEIIRVLPSTNWFSYFIRKYIFRKKKPKIKNCQDLSTVLSDNLKYYRKPVVIFIEGCSSNGKSLMKFQENLFDDKSFALVNNIHPVGFKFEYSSFSPCFHLEDTQGAWKFLLFHIFGCWTQFINSMEIIHLSENKKNEEFGNFVLGRKVKKSRKFLSNMTGLKKVELDMKDKRKFSKYWNKTQKKGYSNEKDE